MSQALIPAHSRWVKTAEALVHRSPEHVDCPCCGSTSLSVRDVEYGFGHEKGIQRYISCGCCGAFTSVNMKRAGEIVKPLLRAAE
jgi:transcription elongation factor Elf1